MTCVFVTLWNALLELDQSWTCLMHQM